jgi:hypothetical protein
VQTPPIPEGPPPGAPVLAPSSPFRSFAQDDLTRAVLVLLIVTCFGLIVVDRVVNRLAPDGIPAAGITATAAHVHPAFQDVPSRVQTNGKPLMLTLRATNTRVDVGYTASRYIFLVDPPNEPPLTLCDGESPICSLPLAGSPRQRGTWTVTLRVYDNDGNIADTRTRVRVT